ncbi:hypothetical protein ACO1K0_14235, partial [Staphylococcus aureus]
YATDVFAPIFAKIQKVSGAPTYTDRVRLDDFASFSPQRKFQHGNAGTELHALPRTMKAGRQH